MRARLVLALVEDRPARESLSRALEAIWHPEYEDAIIDERIHAATSMSVLCRR